VTKLKVTRFPDKMLVFGFLFVIAGAVLLLHTMGFLTAYRALWPVLPLVLGLVLLYFGFAHEGKDGHVFLGMFLALGGTVYLLMNTALSAVALSRIWPLFMTVAGVSLLVYGHTKKELAARASLLIPAFTIVLLSFVFLGFSLNIVDTDFYRFVWNWWPVLLVAFGVALIIAHLGRRDPAP
jgi:hypothetical protein